MKPFYFLFLLLLSNVALSQDAKMCFDKDWVETECKNAEYIRVYKNFKPNEKEIKVIDYYKDGKPIMTGFCEDILCRNKKGLFSYFDVNGILRKECNYDNNEMDGEINQYYDDGLLEFEGKYDNKKLKIKNYWKKNGEILVENGNGKINDFYEENATSSGKIVNGFKDSIWKGTDSKYKIRFIEKYKNGDLIEGESIDSLGVKYKYDEILTKTEPLISKNDFKFYLERKLKNSQFLSNHDVDSEGVIDFVVFVDTNGNIENAKSRYPIDKELESESVKMIMNYKSGFKPKLYRGIPIKFMFKQPIRFLK